MVTERSWGCSVTRKSLKDATTTTSAMEARPPCIEPYIPHENAHAHHHHHHHHHHQMMISKKKLLTVASLVVTKSAAATWGMSNPKNCIMSEDSLHAKALRKLAQDSFACDSSSSSSSSSAKKKKKKKKKKKVIVQLPDLSSMDLTAVTERSRGSSRIKNLLMKSAARLQKLGGRGGGAHEAQGKKSARKCGLNYTIPTPGPAAAVDNNSPSSHNNDIIRGDFLRSSSSSYSDHTAADPKHSVQKFSAIDEKVLSEMTRISSSNPWSGILPRDFRLASNLPSLQQQHYSKSLRPGTASIAHHVNP